MYLLLLRILKCGGNAQKGMNGSHLSIPERMAAPNVRIVTDIFCFRVLMT